MCSFVCSLSPLEEAWLGQGNMDRHVKIEIGTSTQIEIDTDRWTSFQ